MKLSPGAKGLGYLSPGPSSSIPPSSRDCRRPPIVHLAASLRRRPRRRSRPLLRPPRHLLDPPPRPPRVPSTPRRPLDRRVREAPPPTGLDAAPVHLHPNRARGELPHALLILSDPFPLSFRRRIAGAQLHRRGWRPAAARTSRAAPTRGCTPPPRAPKPPCLPGRGRAPHSRRPALRRPERRRRRAMACASWGWAGPLTDQWGPAVSPCLGFRVFQNCLIRLRFCKMHNKSQKNGKNTKSTLLV